MVQPCPTVKPCAKGYPLRILALLFFSVFAFSAMAQAPSGAIIAKNYGAAYTDSVKAWSDANAWIGGVVPGTGDVVYILNSVIVLDTDVEVAAVIVEPYGYLYLYDVNDEASLKTDGSTQYSGTGNGHTLTVTDYVKLTHNVGWKAGDNATKGSTLVLNSTTALGGAGNETIRGTKTLTCWNVEVPSGATVNFNAGGESTASTTILNKLSMKGGAVTGNAPTYGAASTLSYEAAHTVGTEWTHSATTGQGVPQNVSVAASSSLNMGTSSNNYSLRGNLSVDAATSALDLSGMDGNLTVEGNMTLGASGASTLTFTSTEGKGDLIVDGNLTIGASGTISGTQGDLKVGGNLAHSGTGGTFNYVEFNGTAAQTISGTALTIDSLVVDNSDDDVTLADSDVTFSSNVDITAGGVFNPIDGSVDINGTFTMNSDATGTARIATLANNAATSDVDGNITFERYVPAVTDGYSFLLLGNYVKNATRLMWSNSFSPAFNMVMSFDEDFAVLADGGSTAWSVISGDATTLSSDGTGYVVYTSANSSPTITATGTYNTSAVSLAMTSSAGANQGGGMNLITNPFPCPIDGAQLISENTLFSTYYIYDNATDTWNTTLTGAPGTIDIGQSFYVQASAGGNVNFNLTQLTHGTNSFVREVDPMEQGMVGIVVSQEDGRFGKTFVRFHENAQGTFEWAYDVTHRASGNNNNPEVFSVVDEDHLLHLNTPGSKDEVSLVNLTVESGSLGTVSIAMDEDFPLPEGMCGLIVDTETGESTAIGGEPLLVDLQPFTTFENRFILEFMTTPSFSVTNSYCSGGTVHFGSLEEQNQWTITWSSDFGNTGTGCISGLEPGTYEFDATDPESQCISSADLTVSELCMGDFNLNGERDITDLLILLVGIQPVENFDGTFPDTDCDCDGVMTTLDLLTFLPQFGNFCD